MNNNSPLLNTIIAYLFVMYLLFLNNPNLNNEIFVVLPLIIYCFFVFIYNKN